MTVLHRLCLALAVCLPSFAYAQQVNTPAKPQAESQAKSQARPAAQSDIAPAPAQKDPVLTLRPPPDPAGTGDVTSDGRVDLDVVVTDKSGEPVSGLELKDFTLLDNKQPQNILSFHAFDGIAAKPDPPVEVILLIDAVNQGFEAVSFAQTEVMNYLRQNDGHLTQPVSVFWLLDSGLSKPLQSSSDGNALADKIAHQGALTMPGVNRFELSIRALGAIAAKETRTPGRKLLFWMGHGWGFDGECGFFWAMLPCEMDHEPSHQERQNFFNTAVELSSRLREARITLYGSTVPSWNMVNDTYSLQGLKSVSDAMPGNLALRVLAIQSGGDIPKSFDLAGLVRHNVEDSNSFYTMSFNPSHTGKSGEYHSLQVLVDKPGLTVRTKAGYYNQLNYYDQPDPKIKRITVEQLEQVLKASEGMTDSELARQLSGLELIERLNSTKLSFWKAHMPGAKASETLVALADASVFLDPPAVEIPITPRPDFNTQRQILSRTMDYLGKTIPKLPNFFATRTTVRYDDFQHFYNLRLMGSTDDPILHMEASSTATVAFRGGKEIVEADTAKHKKLKAGDKGFYVEGTFGPILGTVILDAVPAKSNLTWSHWEQGENGHLAVFRYVVPQEISHYNVMYCCVPEEKGSSIFQKLTGYHGEIAIDPMSGAILRLALKADLNPKLPVVRSDTMVEYGPVETGGNAYICPVRSVSITRARMLSAMQIWDENLISFGPYQVMLNDVAFGQYHRFSSESRVLTGYDPGTVQK